MNIIQQHVEVFTQLDEASMLETIERAGRTAYKSEDKITSGSAEKFCRMLIKNGHESVLEHVSITVKFVCDRGVTHELVRHRIASYTQESTRYCNYSGGLTVVLPLSLDGDSLTCKVVRTMWEQAMKNAENSYCNMITAGCTPQQARHVLPLSTKTEIVTTMNIREWRHVLKLRTAPSAHPHIRALMLDLLAIFTEKLPVLFGDINPQVKE